VNVVARFNPVSLAARGGLLLAIRTNLFKLADKLQYGLYTEAQATAAGLNLDSFRKMQASYTKTRNLFVNTLKGKEDKLKQAISKGVKHKAINGLGELGELGAVTAARVTAALWFITSILGFFKGKKNPATGETFTDEAVTEGQVHDLMNQSEAMDEDGYIISPSPVNTTAQPEAEQTFWQKAGNFVNNIRDNASNIVSNFLPVSPFSPENLLPRQQIAPKHDNVLPPEENFLTKHDNVADFYEGVLVIDFAIARKQGVVAPIGCDGDAGSDKNLLLQEQIASTGRRLSCFRGTPG
jgi:hypothetical protein